MDGPGFFRDMENEKEIQKCIWDNTDHVEDDDDITSHYLNESGEGLESDERINDEVPSTKSVEVCIY